MMNTEILLISKIVFIGIMLMLAWYFGLRPIINARKSSEDYKSQKKAEQARTMIKDKFAKMNNEINRLKREKAVVSERFTQLAACPGVKERYCTCTPGGECTCGKDKKAETYVPESDYKKEGANLPIRPAQNMVGNVVGKAKQLRAEAALRGAAQGLPMPTGPMLGKDPILTLDGTIEAFRPNTGRF